MKKSTTKDLPEILEARNVNGKYDELISNCKKNMYNDYKSEAAAPKLLLDLHLSKFPELKDIKEANYRGEFDDAADYNDVISMRDDLLQNGTPADSPMFKMLGLTIPQIKEKFPEESKNL